MRKFIKLLFFITFTVFYQLSFANDLPELPAQAKDFIKVEDISNSRFRQVVYARENEALSVIYNFSKPYNFKTVLMSEVKNLKKLQNLPSVEIKYYSAKKLKSMGSDFDAVLFSAFSKQVGKRFDITALSYKKRKLIKIRYTGLNSDDFSIGFNKAMIVSEAILSNMLQID